MKNPAEDKNKKLEGSADIVSGPVNEEKVKTPVLKRGDGIRRKTMVEEEEEGAAAAFNRKKARERDTSGSEGEAELVEQVINIRRVTKVTKGGKKMSFSALVVVGDKKGQVGYSQAKASEVAIAIKKALGKAKKEMVRIPMRGTTIPHEIIGGCGGARVLLRPAGDGTGVIAAGPVRAICDSVGITNILSKCHRSNNPVNVVKAVMDGLTRLKSAK